MGENNQLTQDEIECLLSGIDIREPSGERSDHKQKRGFERLFLITEKTGPYASNLDFLEDLLRYQSQRVVLARAQRHAAKYEGSFEAMAHNFLFFNQHAIPTAARLNRCLRHRILTRLKISDFTPGLIELVNHYQLSRRDTEMVFTVFLFRLEPREINLDDLADLYTKAFADRIQFKSYMRSSTSPIGKRLLYTKPAVFDGDTLQIHGDAFNKILGVSLLEEEYMAYGVLVDRQVDWDNVVLPQSEKERVYSLVRYHTLTRQKLAEWGYDRVATYGLATTILFQGKSGTGKTMFAHALATRIGKKVITADVNELMDNIDSASALRSLLMQARLQDAILFLDECERLLGHSEYRSAKVSDVLKAFEEFDGIIIMTTNFMDNMDQAMRRRILHTVNFEVPGVAAREKIWRAHITEKTQIEGDINYHFLADRYELTGGLIKNSVLLAVATAVDRDPYGPVITQADLEQAAEQQRRAGHAIIAGENVAFHDTFDLRSLVYDGAVRSQIESLVTACRRRQAVWRDWGFAEKFSRGNGVCALFNGPSGTGKTAAAYAIATELGLPVRTVEFAALQSKWFGDTEQNILQLFRSFKANSEVILFDECDSLLSSREGHDSKTRANVVNIFLRQLEDFDGILLMTTNLKQELDSALERRLLFRVDFALPNADMRESIWKNTVPTKAPIAAGIDWGTFAKEFEFSGGQIKNAVLAAMYAALSDASEIITEKHLRLACEQQKNGFQGRKKIGFSAA